MEKKIELTFLQHCFNVVPNATGITSVSVLVSAIQVLGHQLEIRKGNCYFWF